MNEVEIENLLRKGPVVRVPEGLLEQLKRDIRLPRQEMAREEWRAPEPWFKRWIPAVSFAVILLGCVVALAVQASTLTELKQKNKVLRDATANLDVLRAENAEFKKLTLENGELDRLRKDNAELDALRKEIADMQGQMQGLAQLQAENLRLKALLTAPAATAEAGEMTPDAQAVAERVACINNLKQIGLAARIWAGDNNDINPTNYISMTNELSTWKILQCPSDKSRTLSSWDDVVNVGSSYQMLAPGCKEDETSRVFAICPIHGAILLIDGSVQSVGVTNLQKHLKVVDGKTYFVNQ